MNPKHHRLPSGAVRLAAGWLRILSAVIIALPAWADPPSPARSAAEHAEELVLFAGESRILAQHKARRVAVGDGRIVSAVVLDEREILLMANAPGDTTVQVWMQQGYSHSYRIRVQQGDMSRISRDLQDYFRDMPTVRTRTIGDHVVLEGNNVSDADL